MPAVEESGMPAVAMTDQNNLFGMVKFYRAARGQGLKPIFGVDVLLEDEEDDGEREDEGRGKMMGRGKMRGRGQWLMLGSAVLLR